MKKLLIIGTCSADAKAIERELSSRYELDVDWVTTAPAAKKILKENKFDLILVNRILEGDNSNGHDFLDYLKIENHKVPAILLSRFSEAQEKALSKGAVASFDMDLIIGYITPSRKRKHEEVFKILDKYL